MDPWVIIPQESLSLCSHCDDVLLSLPDRTTLHSSSRLLNATYSPNDDEHRKALSCIFEADRDVGELDTVIARLTRVLERVKSQRDLRVRDKDMFRALVNPIRRIPNEIWRKIFPSALQGTEADFGLLQVCRHWRAFLLSSPQIFDRVQLDLTDPHVDQKQYTTLLLEYSARLHGGKTVPRVDISLPEPWRYCALGEDTDASVDFIASLKLHLRYMTSQSWWQSITHIRILNYSPDEWEELFAHQNFKGPRLLEQLAIQLKPVNHYHYPEYQELWMRLMSSFDECQALCSVTIPTTWPIYLQHACSLTSLTIQSWQYNPYDQRPPFGVVDLPRLLHLAIEDIDGIHLFWPSITCPSLVSLHLCGMFKWQAGQRLINELGCTLKSFSVGAASSSSARENLDFGLLEFLESNPAIQHLIYFEPSLVTRRRSHWAKPGYHMSDTLLTQLSFPSTSLRLPQLKTFVTHCPSSQLDSVLAMAESRISEFNGLRHLGIHLLESERVSTFDQIVEYQDSPMTMQDFDTKVEKLRQKGLGVYRVISSPGFLPPPTED
ncbi:hypothetical protein C8J56DRAFT_1053533 [Mycena floridula]|nr:hypothetical protein C8J56DRAFT_1053533 [Mycena floridula]